MILEKGIEKAPSDSIVSGQDYEAEPTEAQIKSGNYKKAKVTYNEDKVVIENPVGSTRRGTNRNGTSWESTMRSDYGYILGTVGADKDHLDVFIRPGADGTEGPIFIIDQVVPGTQKFDEHKIMFGYNNVDDARIGYLNNYDQGWTGLGAITEMTPDQWHRWKTNGDMSQPYFWLLGSKEAADGADK